MCRGSHTSPDSPSKVRQTGRVLTSLNYCFCTEATDMGEHMLLFCLLGLVLTATIILVAAPGAVTWALAFIG